MAINALQCLPIFKAIQSYNENIGIFMVGCYQHEKRIPLASTLSESCSFSTHISEASFSISVKSAVIKQLNVIHVRFSESMHFTCTHVRVRLAKDMLLASVI